MNNLERKLEDALARIAQLEQTQRSEPLSGWEQFRAFFYGKTKLDGNGLQLVTGETSADPAQIVWAQEFHADFVDNPPAQPATVMSNVIYPATPTTNEFSLRSSWRANDPLDTYGALTTFVDATNGIVSLLARHNASTAALDTATLTLEADADECYVFAWAQQIFLLGAIILQNTISPTQLTGNVNDYDPTGLSTAAGLRLTSDASRDITGLAGGTGGRHLWLMNVGAQNIVLKNASGSSAAANQFALKADITLAPGGGCSLRYDTTSDVWRCVGVY